MAKVSIFSIPPTFMTKEEICVLLYDEKSNLEKKKNAILYSACLKAADLYSFCNLAMGL